MKVYEKNGLVYGVGINDLDRAVYQTVNNKQIICPIYYTWKEMLKRCFCPVHHKKQPTYINCRLYPDWLKLSNFERWMKVQDFEGKNLDKDILVVGNKLYSPETCVFISKDLNNFLTDHGARRGIYPLGVSWHKKSKKFQASCSDPFTKKRGYLGYYDNPEDAHLAWKKRKHELALIYAEQQTDPRVAEALRTRYL